MGDAGYPAEEDRDEAERDRETQRAQQKRNEMKRTDGEELAEGRRGGWSEKGPRERDALAGGRRDGVSEMRWRE
jgi:hypothetical protein